VNVDELNGQSSAILYDVKPDPLTYLVALTILGKKNSIEVLVLDKTLYHFS
jgi:hypothetical protein